MVDDEAEGQYGAAQYSEADVIPCSNEENEENLDALRSAVVRYVVTTAFSFLEPENW